MSHKQSRWMFRLLLEAKYVHSVSSQVFLEINSSPSLLQSPLDRRLSPFALPLETERSVDRMEQQLFQSHLLVSRVHRSRLNE